MMFFFDNCYMLVEGNDIANRLSKIAEKTGMLLMACDRCCILREIDKKLVSPAGIGCFLNVYQALSGVGVDQVIAFTFPLVISAIAVKLTTAKFLGSANPSLAGITKMIFTCQTWIAAVLVAYALVRFIMYICITEEAKS